MQDRVALENNARLRRAWYRVDMSNAGRWMPCLLALMLLSLPAAAATSAVAKPASEGAPQRARLLPTSTQRGPGKPAPAREPRLRMALLPEWWQEALLVSGVLSPLLLGLAMDQDQSVAPNRRHAYASKPDRWSHLTGFAVGSLVSSGVLAGLEAAEHNALSGAVMLAISLEASVLAFGANLALKKVFARCRPLAVAADGSCDPKLAPAGSSYGGSEALRSFPSGHVATVAGVSGAMAGMLLRSSWQRGKATPWRWWSLGLSLALTGTTALLRQRAGAHSLTDTLAGAALGLSLGFGVGVVHPTARVQD